MTFRDWRWARRLAAPIVAWCALVAPVGADYTIMWDRAFGGQSWDVLNSVDVCADGGFIMTGMTESQGSGREDLWMIRLDPQGLVLWERPYGGPERESGACVQVLSDGGYIVAGRTSSKGMGDSDFWVLRMDANGGVIWDRTFGGPQADEANDLIVVPGRGYMVSGSTRSASSGLEDAWMLMIDIHGNPLGELKFGGPQADRPNSVALCHDGGFIVAADTESKGAGGTDAWVYRLNAQGGMMGELLFGGPGYDNAHDVRQCPDGGFLVVGGNSSNPRDFSDFWCLRLDMSGQVLWERKFAVNRRGATATAVDIYSDNSSIVAGYFEDAESTIEDVWILNLDPSGEVKWNGAYGGPRMDKALDVRLTPDGGFVAVGITRSQGEDRNEDGMVVRYRYH